MEIIEGVILVLSCEKHKNTRLNELNLREDYYDNWKVIYVIGDISLKTDYILKGNMMYIKCEDSYLHLLKKLGLAIKYVLQLFEIKQGILRCGDDLIFNIKHLRTFLESKKYDFYGKSGNYRDCKARDISTIQKPKYNPFMYGYYQKHRSELTNPKHGINLTLRNLKKYLKGPNILGVYGVVYYISKKACQIIVDTLEKVQYNILHWDQETKCYPYVIEDVGVSYILFTNNIGLKHSSFFFNNKGNKFTIAHHTNKYK